MEYRGTFNRNSTCCQGFSTIFYSNNILNVFYLCVARYLCYDPVYVLLCPVWPIVPSGKIHGRDTTYTDSHIMGKYMFLLLQWFNSLFLGKVFLSSGASLASLVKLPGGFHLLLIQEEKEMKVH